MQPTQRFSDRVADYVRFRPSYPPAILDALRSRNALTPTSVIADIGAGTGKLSKLFLDAGIRTLAIEPNEPMRLAAEEAFHLDPNFKSLPGTAEQTGLPAASVDLIVAGQAFHWFDPGPARQEFLRILKPQHMVALIWNDRSAADAFGAAYQAMLQQHCPEYAAKDYPELSRDGIHRFFAPNSVEELHFENAQQFDEAALLGRMRSSSYVPRSGEAAASITAAAQRLFATHQQQGKVAFRYDTVMYLARLG